jgi:hypothetical protein
LNKEHFVSKALLEELKDETGLKVIGYPHGNFGQILMSVESMAAKMLCEKHNSSLSEVDTEGTRYVLSFFDAYLNLNEARLTRDKKYVFQGPLIERWLLKYVCGLIATGQAGIGEERIIKQTPPVEFLQALFGLETMPPRWGLYVRPPSGPQIQVAKQINLNLYLPGLPNGNLRVSGVKLEHCGFTSMLLLRNPPLEILGTELDGSDLKGAVRHPQSFQFIHEPTGRKVEMKLKWPENSGLLHFFPIRGKATGFRMVFNKDYLPAGA